MHKVTYVKAIHKRTKKDKEKAPNQRKQYINVRRKRYISVHVGSLEVGRQQPRFGAIQAPLAQ